MPSPPSADRPAVLGREDFALLVDAIKAAVAEAIGATVPQLLDQTAAMRYVGLSKSGWFRAKSAGLLPNPVYIDGSGEKWKRRDLDAWVERLKTRRQK